MPERPAESERPWRLFVAVFAPEGVREAVAGTIARLRGRGDVRWVTPERLHLTLKFLGETAPGRAPEIQAALEKSANKFSRFVLQSGGPGAFPNGRKPQTLWLGVEGETDPLIRLASEIEQALAPLGFPPEKRGFRPHLTLGRVKSPKGLAELSRALQEVQAAPPEAASWPVEELHLVRSFLRPAGPDYVSLQGFPLRNPGS